MTRRSLADRPAASAQRGTSMNSKDWTLLVIAAAKGKEISPVQLQKTLFLIDRNLSPEQRKTRNFYEFQAYDYGPFNRAIYDDAADLGREGLVLIYPEAGTYRQYIALPAGLERANDLRSQLDPTVTEYLDGVV
jgi:uncharacterized protein